MVATNDDILSELQKITKELKFNKKLLRGLYGSKEFAQEAENKNDE